MCRFLAVKSKNPVLIENYLKEIARISKNSKEYQGHGWGIAKFDKGKWIVHKEIKPIWESNLSGFGESNHFIVHARSAFQDEGIEIENNMPFVKDNFGFVFNGEIRGVKIKEEGRIGAEKIFNFILKPSSKTFTETLTRKIKIIDFKSNTIRALNFVLSDGAHFFTWNQFSEDPKYFTLNKSISSDLTMISSKTFGEHDWSPVLRNYLEVL